MTRPSWPFPVDRDTLVKMTVAMAKADAYVRLVDEASELLKGAKEAPGRRPARGREGEVPAR